MRLGFLAGVSLMRSWEKRWLFCWEAVSPTLELQCNISDLPSWKGNNVGQSPRVCRPRNTQKL